MAVVTRPFRVLHTFPTGVVEAEVNVLYDTVAYGRKTTPDLEAAIEAEWQLRLADKPPGTLFNGTKFRLAGVTYLDTSDGLLLTMRLGFSDYRQLVGTNFAATAAELRASGVADHGDADAYMAQVLGVGAVVETADDHVLLLLRSHSVGEAGGMVDVPGGHPEPSEIGVDADTKPTDELRAVIAHELYHSMQREVEEELGLPLARLSPPAMIAILANASTSFRPSMLFRITFDGSAAEARELYKGAEDAYESTNWFAVPFGDIDAAPDDLTALPGVGPLAPACQGSLHVWRSLRAGVDPPPRSGPHKDKT